MAEMISFVLETLNGMSLDCKYPADLTAREVADDLAMQLNYPLVNEDTNEPINYFLTDGGGKRIEDDAKLEDAGLRDGGRVKIEVSKAISRIPMPDAPAPPPGQVGVWIKLLDQTRNVYEQFDAETTVSDLLAQMIAKYDLPAQYPSSNEPIVYIVSSKRQGRQMHVLETLREARIPHLDTIFISTVKRAGGGAPLTPRVLLRPVVGLRLDEVTEVGIPALMENEPALKMALHAFKDTLYQLEESRQELQEAKGRIEQLTERLKGNNIATALLLVGQIQIGFATNLITNDSRGGWFVFFSGLALNLGALYFSVFSGRKAPRV